MYFTGEMLEEKHRIFMAKRDLKRFFLKSFNSKMEKRRLKNPNKFYTTNE